MDSFPLPVFNIESEDEEDHDNDVHNTNSHGNVHAQSNQPIVIETTKAFNNPTTSATSSSSSLQQQLQTKEEIEDATTNRNFPTDIRWFLG